jgi:hypothetical protein
LMVGSRSASTSSQMASRRSGHPEAKPRRRARGM